MMAESVTEGDIFQKYKAKSFIYENQKAAWDMLSHFQECRIQKKFIDAVIKVETETFRCHKIILTAHSPYFESYYSFHEECDETALYLKGVSAKGFSPLLEYMYTTSLQITAENALAVLQCADFLLMPEVAQQCARLAIQHLSPSNCVEALLYGETLSLPGLREAAVSYVVSHLSAVAEAGDFYCLTTLHICEILTSPGLDGTDEKPILDALFHWVTVDQDKVMLLNFFDLPQVFCCLTIPWHSVESRFGGLCSFREVFRDEMYYEVKTYDNVNPNNAETSPEVMVVVNSYLPWTNSGKTTPEEARKLFYFHPKEKEWKSLTDLPFLNRRYFGACVVHNKIYITGGDGRDHEAACPLSCKDVWEFDPICRKWEKKGDMLEGRHGHSSTGLHSNIFIVGGAQHENSSFGEVYNPRTEQSTILPPIPGLGAIYNASSVAVGEQLFLIGGLTTSLRPDQSAVGIGSALASSEAYCYEPFTGNWQELPSLSRELENRNLCLSCSSVAVVEGLLVLSGENRGCHHLVYNPVTKQVHELLQPHNYHRNSGILVLDGRLLCLCGSQDLSALQDEVHYVDLDNVGGGWKSLGLVPCDMLCLQPLCLKTHISFD